MITWRGVPIRWSYSRCYGKVSTSFLVILVIVHTESFKVGLDPVLWAHHKNMLRGFPQRDKTPPAHECVGDLAPALHIHPLLNWKYQGTTFCARLVHPFTVVCFLGDFLTKAQVDLATESSTNQCIFF